MKLNLSFNEDFLVNAKPNFGRTSLEELRTSRPRMGDQHIGNMAHSAHALEQETENRMILATKPNKSGISL